MALRTLRWYILGDKYTAQRKVALLHLLGMSFELCRFYGIEPADVLRNFFKDFG